MAPLAKALAAQSWSVWWDRQTPAGKPFTDDIDQALDAAKCVIVIWSKDSINSRWVKNEARRGFNRSILVPVSIDPVTMPLEFSDLQAIEMIGWPNVSDQDSFERLIENVSALVGPSSLANDDPGRQSSQFTIAEPAPSFEIIGPNSKQPYVFLLFSCLYGGFATVLFLSNWLEERQASGVTIFLVFVAGAILNPFIGLLVSSVANKLRSWANGGRVKEFNKPKRILQMAFWPIVLIYSLVWYPFFWAVNKIIRN